MIDAPNRYMEYWPALAQHAVVLEKGSGFLLISISNERPTIPGLGQGRPILHHSRGLSSGERDYLAESVKGVSRAKFASPWIWMLSPKGSIRRSPFSSNSLAFMWVRCPLGKFRVRTSNSGSSEEWSILNPPCRG
jgi:hypothetical protein